MSRHDDSIAEIIPWVANNSATKEEQSRVEAHLSSCADCRELMDQARQFTGRGLDGGDLAGHPPAVILRELTEEPERIPAEARPRLMAHLHECSACRSATDALVALESLPDARRRDAGGTIWLWLTRTILSPQLAVAYLIILAIGLGWLVTRPPANRPDPQILPAAVSLPGEILFRGEQVGEDSPTILLDLPTEPGQSVHLSLETDIDDADLVDPVAAFEVRLSQDSRVVWSRKVPGTAFSEIGLLDIVVPAALLRSSPVTKIEILLDRSGARMHGKALYTRSIGIR